VRQSSVATTLGEADAVFAGKEPIEVSLAVVSPNVGLREEFSWFENKPLFGWRSSCPAPRPRPAP
jgi:uroporphyrinogen III methyltransferase/synthase